MRSLAVLSVVLTSVACQAAEPLAERLGPAPVVVELFTSQGCSSCPPADALLGELANDPALRGRVIPLAFHVDYWNRLGWRDPFSSAEWSRRQYFYVRALGANSAYTPQMVVNGARQFVGSNRGALDKAMVELSHRRTAGIVRVKSAANAGKLDVVVDAQLPPGAPRHDVLIAVVEEGATTRVERGENSGRTLRDTAIVRILIRAGSVASGAFHRKLTVELDPSWGRVSVVAFLQNSETLAVGGAAAAL